ncbi:VOC family protein [Roseateles sp. P5_D6]
MQLNHLDLSVPDVTAATAFFEAAFGFTLRQIKGNDGMAILDGEGGFVLVLTRAKDATEPMYPKTFHIGFLLASEQAVMSAHARMLDAGIELAQPPRVMRGSLMFYCHAPGGILVEVSHRTVG